jgi:hypothetical protein
MQEGGSETGDCRWFVRVPRGAEALRVWVNGVEQREGDDYVRRGDMLTFAKPLAKEGRIGFWRWALMVLGIAGTYRKNDSVDVQYELNGRTNLATRLDIEAQ